MTFPKSHMNMRATGSCWIVLNEGQQLGSVGWRTSVLTHKRGQRHVGWRGTWPCSCHSAGCYRRWPASQLEGTFITMWSGKGTRTPLVSPHRCLCGNGTFYRTQGTAFWDCLWLTGCFRVGMKSKMRKGRDQGNLGGTSARKQKGKGIKRGGCVYKLLVTVLVWPCPEPNQVSLSLFSH